MEIKALGYIGIQSDKLADWDEFATQLLGMQRVDRAKGIHAFRMDDRKQRLIVDSRNTAEPGFFGWEVERRDDLESLAARLDACGHHVERGTRALADERFVTDLITFADPAGNRLEVFWKPMLAEDEFIPGRPLSGFKTGPLGMGHVVWQVEDISPMLTFYRDVLKFSVSDFANTPIKLHFFHVNQRHHSLALVETGKRGFHHFMVELLSLDDVGQGYDLAFYERESVAYGLGRHTNDYMTSFYAHTPSEFFVEYGWGGRMIDLDAWVPYEMTDGPSFWGHERYAIPPDQRAEARKLRLDAAAKGLRADVDLDCPWLNSVIARD